MVYTVKTSVSANVGLKQGKFPEKAIATKPASFFKMSQKGITNLNELIDDILARVNANRQPDIAEANRNSENAKKILLPPNLSETIFKNLKVGVKVSGNIEIAKEPTEEVVSPDKEIEEKAPEVTPDEEKTDDIVANDPIEVDSVENSDVAENGNIDNDKEENIDTSLNDESSIDFPETDINMSDGNSDDEITAAVDGEDLNLNTSDNVELSDFFAGLNDIDVNTSDIENDTDTPTELIENENVDIDNQDISNKDNENTDYTPVDYQTEEKSPSSITTSDNIPTPLVDGYNSSTSDDFDPYVQSARQLENELVERKQAKDEAERVYKEVYDDYTRKLEEITAMGVQLKELKNNLDQASQAYETISGAKKQALGILSGSNQLYEASVEANLVDEVSASNGIAENNNGFGKGM